jgi:hypothetical protein
MLDLRKFLPGKAHSSHACGTIAQFDQDLAERVQKLMNDLEISVREVYESIASQIAD